MNNTITGIIAVVLGGVCGAAIQAELRPSYSLLIHNVHGGDFKVVPWMGGVFIHDDGSNSDMLEDGSNYFSHNANAAGAIIIDPHTYPWQEPLWKAENYYVQIPYVSYHAKLKETGKLSTP